MRIGHGYDLHAFRDGNFLVLGGVRIPFIRAIRAHSDGDVLLHALANALLGAAGLGDIGRHFPDTEEKWRGADSRELLRAVRDKVRAQGLRAVNVDATIIAQAPRLAPYLPAMCANIAADLVLPPQCVNVKAATAEHLGAIGRGEGLAAEAVVLLDGS